tara:strand:+ start:403 stop:771 length:369 start_codon:yes stop_codon:yes gene_type:complete
LDISNKEREIKMGKKKTRKERVCGNCGESGHDKRTCGAAPSGFNVTIQEARKRNTEAILDALVDVVNDLTVSLKIPMHLECAHHSEGSNVWLIDGPDLDGEQAIYALVGAIHQARAVRGSGE